MLIPTFNRADFLSECIDSILTQSLTPSQVLVVNDGSTDRTQQVLDAYGNDVEIVEEAHKGKPAALNAGLPVVTGEYLWIFDDDDVALPDAVERFVEPLEASPEYGFTYSSFYYTATEAGSTRLGPVVGMSTVPDVDEQGFLVALLESNFLGGAALFARRSCYETVGEFDQELLRSQDYDMAIRIARQFTGVRVVGAPTFHYRQHDGQRGANRDRFDASQRFPKWLQYDQIIFSRLYRELPLVDYLPVGRDVDELRRQAHLQRLSVLASKLLVDEACAELSVVAGLSADRGGFSEEERRLVGTLATAPYYGVGRLVDHPRVAGHMRELARNSPVIRQLRTELVRTLACQPNSRRPWRAVRQFAEVIQTSVGLYGRAGRSFLGQGGPGR